MPRNRATMEATEVQSCRIFPRRPRWPPWWRA